MRLPLSDTLFYSVALVAVVYLVNVEMDEWLRPFFNMVIISVCLAWMLMP